MNSDEAAERRALWKHYSAIVAALSTTYALLVGLLFFLAPEFVVPVAIAGAIAIAVVSSILVRRTVRQDPLTRK